MKKIIVVASIAALFAIGCKKTESVETQFYFAEAQPVNDSELTRLPEKYRGTYQGAAGDTLKVDSGAIYTEYAYRGSIPKDSVATVNKVGSYVNGKYRLKDEDEKNYTVREDKDSIYINGRYRDTLFAFSDAAKAKRINGQVVLSRKDSIYWKVSLLSIKNDSLSLRLLSRKEDYNLLQAKVKDISTNSDTTVVHIKPSRREFKTIIKLKLDADSKYKKIE
jgi:hypothetical protein